MVAGDMLSNYKAAYWPIEVLSLLQTVVKLIWKLIIMSGLVTAFNVFVCRLNDRFLGEGNWVKMFIYLNFMQQNVQRRT